MECSGVLISSIVLREQSKAGFQIRFLVGDAEFFSNAVSVKIDAVFGDTKKFGDFFACVPVPDEPSNPNFRG